MSDADMSVYVCRGIGVMTACVCECVCMSLYTFVWLCYSGWQLGNQAALCHASLKAWQSVPGDGAWLVCQDVKASGWVTGWEMRDGRKMSVIRGCALLTSSLRKMRQWKVGRHGREDGTVIKRETAFNIEKENTHKQEAVTAEKLHISITTKNSWPSSKKCDSYEWHKWWSCTLQLQGGRKYDIIQWLLH